MNDNEQNPYEQNSLQNNDQTQPLTLLEQPRKVSVGQGFNWLEKGISGYVVPHFGKWIVGCAIYAFIIIVVSMAAPVGGLLLQFLAPFFTAGILMGCHKISQGNPINPYQIFEAFSHANKIQLLLFCLLRVVIIIIMFGIVFLMAGMSAADLDVFQKIQANPEDPQVVIEIFKKFAYLIPFLFIMGIIYSLSVWFAPSLIVFNNKSAPVAVGMSFKAGIRNIVPYLLFLLIAIVLFTVIGIIGSIVSSVIGFASETLGQILMTFAMTLITVPIMGAAMYVSYRDIFYGDFEKETID